MFNIEIYYMKQRNLEWLKIKYENIDSAETVCGVRAHPRADLSIAMSDNLECNSQTTFGLLMHKLEASD